MTESQNSNGYNPEDIPVFNDTIEDLLQDLDPIDEQDFFPQPDPAQELEQLRLDNLALRTKIQELEASKPAPTPELLPQLETASETIQSQQLLIETLSQQLADTQDHLARLERECTQVQENYHQQTYKLLETEKQLQELHKRLLRQQRYTLEYKTTLERCFREQSIQIINQTASVSKNVSITPWSEPKVSEPTPPPVAPASQPDWPSPAVETEALTTSPVAPESQPVNKPDWPSPAVETEALTIPPVAPESQPVNKPDWPSPAIETKELKKERPLIDLPRFLS